MPSKPTMLRFGRGTIMAMAIVATSGVLEISGLPLFSAMGKIAYNLAAAQSEAKKLREKAAAWQARC